MGAFEDLRDRLAEHRDKHEAARAAALHAREKVLSLERTLQVAERAAPDAAALTELKKQYAAAKAAAGSARDRLAELTKTGAGLAASMAAFTDPTKALARLSDLDPILLFPVRLETRFKPSPSGTPQLWVRIYPDTCLVDGFEERLTEAEITNGTAFWAALWRACGEEGLERAAWRELVAASGAGRAGWVVRTLLPRNPTDKPEPNDGVVPLILVATGPQPPEVAAYWAAIWSAQGEPAATAQADADLEAALGADRAALVRTQPPINLDDPPPAGLTPAQTTPVVTVLQLPDAAELGARTSSWSSAPRLEALPDRFVLLGYDKSDGKPSLIEVGNPVPAFLQAGPDPQAEPDDQLKPVGADANRPDTLHIPDGLAWMFDFERALEAGMAFRVDLTPAQAKHGFARLLVLGVRVSQTPAAGATALSRLLEHHLYSRAGLELLAQGTPTNDTDKGGAGYTWRDDSDASFYPFVRQQPQYDRVADPLTRADGQWFADALALPDALATRIPGAGRTDRAEAHAMQIALWPATIGYFLDTLLAPAVSDQAVAATRKFFTRHVTGRGPLPALRIGDQPYGIQPAVAFSRLGWFRPPIPDAMKLPSRLATLIRQVEEDWRPLLGQVSRIGGGADRHQELLDVLGLHPTSVEYYPLGADSLAHKVHELSFFDLDLATQLAEMFPPNGPLALLRRLGYDGEKVPDALKMIYRGRQKPLDGPLIDDVPLSETAEIRAYAGGRNYIQWLADAAADSITAVQAEQGFDGGKRPTALLYLLLRHALQLSFRQSAIDLLATAGTLPDKTVLRPEPVFVHVADAPAGGGPAAGVTAASTESRYGVLFATQEQVTGEAELTIGDYIARHIRDLKSSVLPEHLAALDRLAALPTARLERLMAEHVDTASYRLDAWRTGLIGWALEQVRAAGKTTKQPLTHRPSPTSTGRVAATGAGLHLGAYGWVEDLRPEGKALTPVRLPTDLAAAVDGAVDSDGGRHDAIPLTADPTNLGLVHAPSLNHATTAAVLRNAHIAHQGRTSVNLSSRRVTAALAVLEGMRGGQSLGALLGYQLERHVHDHGPLTVRDLIYPLRREYPLAADQIQDTATTQGQARESIAAMNVVDGRKLLLHVESSGTDLYPFANPRLPRRTAAEEAAVTDAVRHIRDVNDAVADLVLAEGVHQAVLGNYDRCAATLDAFAKGNHPPEPEVIRTPRSGTGLTLRTALHLPTSAANPLPFALTPLALADPAVNHWLAARLPDPANVAVRVTYTDRTTGTDDTLIVTQAKLGLHPADLLYRAAVQVEQSLSDLDERIVEHLHKIRPVRLDRPVEIRHTERIPGAVTFFELEGLLGSLRQLIVGARPLRPGDLVRQADARSTDQDTTTLPRPRLADARDSLRDTLAPTLTPLVTTIADPTRSIDDVIAAYADTVGPFARYRIEQAGTGFAFEWRAETFSRITALIDARVSAWNERLARHDRLLDDYAALPASATDEERLQLLRTADVLVSTTVGAGLSPPAHLASLTPKRAAFVTKRDDLHNLVTTPRPTLAELLSDVAAADDVAAYDHEPLDLDPEIEQIDRFRSDLTERIKALAAEVDSRVAAAGAALTAHDAAPTGTQADLLRDGLRALLGEDLVVVPQFTLPAAAATELDKAWTHSTNGGLTRHLTDPPPAGSGRDFPEEDWLHGVARVRDQLHHLENVILLCSALPGASAPALVPLQLPHEDGRPWLALELPPGTEITSEQLLYTAVDDEPFNPSRPLCGLLIDEWSEVIPAREQTTGVAFHHDRPNAEPPQAWLLALPATFDGSWSFDDLVGAVTDTLDAAQLRALEPRHLDHTAYAALLPATHSAWTFPEISISHNLLRNVSIYDRLVEAD